MTRESLVSGVLLAAGPSLRFGPGVSKQLLEFEGEPLVRRAAREALDSRLREVLAVVGHEWEKVGQALEGLAVQLVVNRDFVAGQSTSVRIGLARVSAEADAALFLTADQPFLTASVIDRIIGVYEESGGPIVVPAFAGQRGSPVLFDRSLFSELEGITGDSGGRQLFPGHADEIVDVPLEDSRPFLDIDTPEAYQRLLQPNE